MSNQPKNPGLKWPKTEKAKAQELQRNLDAVAAISQVGQLMTAANAVPNPRAKKLMTDAAAAASKGNIGSKSKTKKGKKRAWEQHADEYFAENKAWDEVNGIYLGCVDLLKTSLALVPLLKEIDLVQLVKNKNLLARNIAAITRDTTVLVKDLNKIKASHKDKSGGTKTQAEMMDSCAVFTDYVQFMERYDSALMPLVVHASEQLQEALIDLQHSQPELAQTLNTKLQLNLHSIRQIVHEVTGADEIVTPGQEDAVQAEAPANEAVAEQVA